MIFYNKVLALLLARPWSMATCLRLLTLSAGDEHTSGHQQNLVLSIRIFMNKGVPLSVGGPSMAVDMAVDGTDQADPCNMAALRGSVKYLTTGQSRS